MLTTVYPADPKAARRTAKEQRSVSRYAEGQAKVKEIKSERIQMMVTPGELAAIDDSRFSNRVGSRSEASRRLALTGLQCLAEKKRSEEAEGWPNATTVQMIRNALAALLGPSANLIRLDQTRALPEDEALALIEALERVRTSQKQ